MTNFQMNLRSGMIQIEDGYGDELSGYQGDSCPSQQGNSTIDKFGCLDRDGDGYSNDGDDLPDNPTQYFDLDGDGYGDNRDQLERYNPMHFQ